MRKGASRIYYPGSSGIDRSLLIDIGFGHSSCILIASSKSQENRDGQGQIFHVGKPSPLPKDTLRGLSSIPGLDKCRTPVA